MQKTCSTIREDYKRQAYWTVAEAADYAGVKSCTVRKWLQKRKKGRKLFHVGLVAGPYRVDASSFVNYLKTGTPQGN